VTSRAGASDLRRDAKRARILRNSCNALVLAEEDLLVHLLEVEHEIERTPQARILELIAAGV